MTFFRSNQCPKGSILEVIDLEVTLRLSDFFSKRPIFETKLILEVTDFEMTYYSMCPFFRIDIFSEVTDLDMTHSREDRFQNDLLE